MVEHGKKKRPIPFILFLMSMKLNKYFFDLFVLYEAPYFDYTLYILYYLYRSGDRQCNSITNLRERLFN